MDVDFTRTTHIGTHNLFKSQQLMSFEDRVPVDEIYGYPIFKWVGNDNRVSG